MPKNDRLDDPIRLRAALTLACCRITKDLDKATDLVEKLYDEAEQVMKTPETYFEALVKATKTK